MLIDPDTTSQAETAVRAALEAVRTDLHDARAALDHGRAINLAGIDGRIAALCAQALGLPPPLARRTLPDLLALRDSADRLIESLTAGRTR
jgi:hypothetical protein